MIMVISGVGRCGLKYLIRSAWIEIDFNDLPRIVVVTQIAVQTDIYLELLY